MNRQISIPNGAEQWLINLIELKNRKPDIPFSQIAEKENLSEKSISNVFSGKSKNPGVDLVRRIIHALGGTWSEIFGESGAVIGGQNLAELQTEVDRLKEELALLQTNLNITDLENGVLKDKVTILENENKILCIKLEYEAKLNAVHDFYNKLKSSELLNDTAI